MEILECPLYGECREEECPYYVDEDCTYIETEQTKKTEEYSSLSCNEKSP